MSNEEKVVTGADVLTMLIPTGGWVIYGDDFSTIRYDEGINPLTKKQYDDGFTQYETWAAQQEAEKADAKQSVLDRLGLTQEEAKLLLA
jgi:hypothetical protein